MTSGCLARSPTAPDQCIECFEALHLYEGHCYKNCPAQTYSSILLTAHGRAKVPSTETPSLPLKSSIQTSEEVSSSLMRRALTDQLSLSPEAADMMAYEQAHPSEQQTPKMCFPCHYTCATCSGPSNNQCLSCPDDAELVNITSLNTHLFFCYPSALVPNSSTGNTSTANWYYQLNFVLTIVLVIVCCVTLYYFLSCAIKYGFCEFCCCDRGGVDSVSYDKVALDEGQLEAQQIKEEIERATQTSDSESEDDLNL